MPRLTIRRLSGSRLKPATQYNLESVTIGLLPYNNQREGSRRTMAGFWLAMLFAFVYAVNGQTAYFDIGTSINEVTPPASPEQTITEPTVADGARKICYDGNQVLYTDADRVLRQDGSVAISSPNGETIWGLTCCCDVIAITYSTATQLRIRFNGAASDIDVDKELRALDLEENVPEYAVVHCEASDREMIAISGDTLSFISVDTLTFSPHDLGLLSSIEGIPTCLSYRKTGDPSVYHVYLSVSGGDHIVAVRYENFGFEITEYMMSDEEGNPLVVYCVDYDDDVVYALVQDVNDQYSIRSIPYDDVIDGSGTDTSGSGTVFFQPPDGTGGISSESATGLAVCGNDCAAEDCSAGGACECAPAMCGFCVYGANLCQCDNYLLDFRGCEYHFDVTICDQCIDQPDTQVMVYNPLGKRRVGEINVYGVLVGVGDVTLCRAVKVGMFDPESSPKPFGASNIFADDNGLTIAGFDAPAPEKFRGSRFGVYWADILPDGKLFHLVIPGVVTENSGFINTHYTITANLNEDVTLDASMVSGLRRYASGLKWLFTPVDLNAKRSRAPRTPPCKFVGGIKRKCKLRSVTRTNEGVYEVFRDHRRLRNWHPIFYLFVRQCEAGAYGDNCIPCPECGYGLCDDVCGDCICYPGWTGPNCDTPCAELSLVGDSCTVDCGDVFEDSKDCKRVMICKPGRLGCACRSGLQSPECLAPCRKGFYGPNCKEKCDCAGGDCDPVIGCPNVE